MSRQFHPNPLMNILHRERFRSILQACPKLSSDSVALDLGGGEGYLSRMLSSHSTVVCLDIVKQRIIKGHSRGKSETLHFVVADISSLPFRKKSVDLVVCASVLEHFSSLETPLKQLKQVLKHKATLLASYPIETWFFRAMLRLFCPKDYRYIDPSYPFWQKQKDGSYSGLFGTHKQDYKQIRQMLDKHFILSQRLKMPFSFLPDLLTFYECQLLIHAEKP